MEEIGQRFQDLTISLNACKEGINKWGTRAQEGKTEHVENSARRIGIGPGYCAKKCRVHREDYQTWQ